MARPMDLYRAAKDDYVDTGYSFAESIEAARAYLDNPGFGGASLYTAVIDPRPEQVIDLTDVSTSELADMLGLSDPGAIGVDEWIPRDPGVTDGLRELGYLWAVVRESYPANTRTWIWCGVFADGEPELTELA